MLLRDLCVSSSAEELSIQPFPVKTRGRHVLRVLPAVLLLFAFAAQAQNYTNQAQSYTNIVVFGDSLSDTGNDFFLFSHIGFPFPAPYPIPPLNYTVAHFTDGLDTTPAVQNPLYQGVWIEQLAATLPAHPLVLSNRLFDGTNYAYGYGNTLEGTTTFNLFDDITVDVENVGQQIDDYLATNPKIDNHTLFVVWGGANNLTEAVGATNAPAQIINGAIAQIGNIQRLINAGATQFLVPNLPDLGLIPRFNSSPVTSVPFHQATVLYNKTLDAGVSFLPIVNFARHVTIHKFDIYSLMNQIVASPASYGLLNVTQSSQFTAVNPDQYLFWDDLHPTTRGHNLLGQAALKLIEPKGCVVQVLPGEYVGVAAPGCR